MQMQLKNARAEHKRAEASLQHAVRIVLNDKGSFKEKAAESIMCITCSFKAEVAEVDLAWPP